MTTADASTSAVLDLPSHFSAQDQIRIKRLILEDFKASDVKSPTYMKLLARYIAPIGVSEDWLSKLRHQTMATMLSGASTPRYEFWACLYLYLTRKHGPECLNSADMAYSSLGGALAAFAQVAEPPVALSMTTGADTIRFEPSLGALFATVQIVRKPAPGPDEDPLRLSMQRCLKGVGIVHRASLHACVRDVQTKAFEQLTVALTEQTA